MRPDLVKQVSQAMMERWGELSEDTNPLHVDPDYAQGSRYGGTIAHGHMVVAWLTEWLRAGREPGALRGLRLRRLRFLQPVRPGTSYRVRGGDGTVEIVREDGQVVLTALVSEGDQEEVSNG